LFRARQYAVAWSKSADEAEVAWIEREILADVAEVLKPPEDTGERIDRIEPADREGPRLPGAREDKRCCLQRDGVGRRVAERLSRIRRDVAGRRPHLRSHA
jgi:hypothetical protein